MRALASSMVGWLIALPAIAFAQPTDPAPPAAPSPTDKAAAETLFDVARELMDAQRYAEACPRFAESQRLDPTLGTLLNLARCHQLEGKTATAWAEYREVSARADQDPARAEAAAKFAEELAPSLSTIRIVVAASPPHDLVITRNGVEMSASSLGVDLPVDPGPQRFEARAAGFQPWTTTVDLGDKADRQTVVIPALAPEPAAPPAILPSPAPSPSFGPPTPADRGPSGISQTTYGLLIGGAGLASVAVGSIFGAVAASQVSDAESDPALCPDRVCSDEGFEQIGEAETMAWVANVTIGLGIVAAAAGGVLIALDPGEERAVVGWRADW